MIFNQQSAIINQQLLQAREEVIESLQANRPTSSRQ